LITEFKSPSIFSKSLVMPEAALFRIKRWWLPSNTPSDVNWFSSSDLKKIVSTLVINSSDLQLHNVYRNIMYQMLYLKHVTT